MVFPSDSPTHGSGPGAIVWSATAGCAGGTGARVAGLLADDRPGPSRAPRSAAGRPIAPVGVLTASAAPHGKIVIAGSSPRGPAGGLLIQGSAGGPSRRSRPTVARPPRERSRVPTWATSPSCLPRRATAAAGSNSTSSASTTTNSHATSPSAVPERGCARSTVAMDYRSEALVLWARSGAIYARVVSNKGALQPTQRLARFAGNVRIAAVLSDDRRGIVAWSEQQGSETSVYIDRSGTGERFGAPKLLERFRDPDGLPTPTASPSLVRLSSESVMLAWAGSAGGRWVLRVAPVDLRGVRRVTTIAAARERCPAGRPRRRSG